MHGLRRTLLRWLYRAGNPALSTPVMVTTFGLVAYGSGLIFESMIPATAPRRRLEAYRAIVDSRDLIDTALTEKSSLKLDPETVNLYLEVFFRPFWAGVGTATGEPTADVVRLAYLSAGAGLLVFFTHLAGVRVYLSQ